MQAARDATGYRHRGECIEAEGAAAVDGEVAWLPCERAADPCDGGVWDSKEDQVAGGGDPRGVGGEFHFVAKHGRQVLCRRELPAGDRSQAVAGRQQAGGESGGEPSRANESHRYVRAAWHGNKEGTPGARRQR